MAKDFYLFLHGASKVIIVNCLTTSTFITAIPTGSGDILYFFMVPAKWL